MRSSDRPSSKRCACTKRDLEALLREHAFTRHFDLVVHSIAPGRCRVDVPFQPTFERPGGVISGQVFMAVADVAMWLAIKTQLGLADASVTADMYTRFLRPGRKSLVRCTARTLKLGQRLIAGVAECRDPSGQLLTHHTISYVRQTGDERTGRVRRT